MKTILGFFLLLIWLPSNLGAILPRFDLKVLLLVCYLKMISITGLGSTFSVMCPVAPAALQSQINSDVWTLLPNERTSDYPQFCRILTQGLEPKVPDCAVILV